MGDTFEITTWPKQQNYFYPVSSSGLLVDIKAPALAAIGLAQQPGQVCDYWICLGDNNHSWIKKDDDHLKSEFTPNILSTDMYHRFWVQWNAGLIRLGKDGDHVPIVTYPNDAPNLKYVTFSLLKGRYGLRHCVHWRFTLPPELPKFEMKPVSGGKLKWIQADTQLPDEAVIGGCENETLYIMRSEHRGSLTPGKFVPSEGVGYISWGGQSHSKTSIEVLCGFDCTWVPTWEDKIPIGAVEGGYSEDHNERLYVGRVLHQGHMIPGKIQPSHKVCYISYKNCEIGKPKYEVLVEPANLRCVKETFMCDMNTDRALEYNENEVWEEDDDEDNDNDDGMHGFDMNEVMVL